MVPSPLTYMLVTRCPANSWVSVAGPFGASVARGRGVTRTVGTRVTEMAAVDVTAAVDEIVGDSVILVVALTGGEPVMILVTLTVGDVVMTAVTVSGTVGKEVGKLFETRVACTVGDAVSDGNFVAVAGVVSVGAGSARVETTTGAEIGI